MEYERLQYTENKILAVTIEETQNTGIVPTSSACGILFLPSSHYKYLFFHSFIAKES